MYDVDKGSRSLSHLLTSFLHLIRPESYIIRWHYAAVRAITPFKVIQSHRFYHYFTMHRNTK